MSYPHVDDRPLFEATFEFEIPCAMSHCYAPNPWDEDYGKPGSIQVVFSEEAKERKLSLFAENEKDAIERFERVMRYTKAKGFKDVKELPIDG